jgi:hypothetical protein
VTRLLELPVPFLHSLTLQLLALYAPDLSFLKRKLKFPWPIPMASPTPQPIPHDVTLEIQPAAGLEHIKELPFSVANFKKAIEKRLDDGDEEWIVFSDFDYSMLESIDKLRYPVRLHIEGNKLVVKMVHKVHEAMHCNLMDLVKMELGRMGLEISEDYMNIGSGRCKNRSGNSSKESDSSIAPVAAPQPSPEPWPSFVIEAGWSESLRRLRSDADWWLSAQVPPINTRLVVLISFKRQQRTFHLEKYEIVTVTVTGGPVTRSASQGTRNMAIRTQVTRIDLRSTPPIITGAPLVLPFDKIMQRPPTAAQGDILLSAVRLERWATLIARKYNL